MLPSELKLASLGHCYLQIPEAFLYKEQNLKAGAIVSVRSVQNDTELCVIWNGQFSPGKYAQLDLTFAKANGLQDELIVLSLIENFELPECTLCRVELVEASDYSILSEHLDANLLDTCKLVSKDLVIPIFLSLHVQVLVKVISLQPDKEFALLTKWTDMQFQHSLDKIPPRKEQSASNDEENSPTITEQNCLITCSLGINYKPKFTQLSLGSLLICGEQGSGKTHYLENTLRNFKKFNSELFNCQQLRSKRPENVKKRLDELVTSALDKQPSILALDNIDSILSKDPKHEEEKGQEVIYRARMVAVFCNMLNQLLKSEKNNTNGRTNVIVIATCRSIESLDKRISKPKGGEYFNEIVKLAYPTIQKRVSILREMISEHKQIQSTLDDNQLEIVAKRCESYTPLDLKLFIQKSISIAYSKSPLDIDSNSTNIQLDDLLESLDNYVPSNLRGLALQPKTVKCLENVGGMAKIKETLQKTIVMQTKYPKLFDRCPIRMQNSILLYGPPGCGKTLIVEAFTNQAGINSICVKGSELLSKYIGASEAAVRDLFKRAEMAKPGVIFFDEFESLVSKRGSDSTGVTDRVVNQFLTLMDGVDRLSSNIFIIAASNQPERIDPAILRPGRLDKHIYCTLPDQKDRLAILNVLSKDLIFEDSEVDLNDWSERLECFTGADIQSFLHSAHLKALHEIVGPSNQWLFESKDKLSSSIETENTTDTNGNRSREEIEKLVIKVGQFHLEESFNEMRAEVIGRYGSVKNQFPPSIRRTGGQKVAVRATLA